MDMSILGQEPVSRDWQGITNVSDPDHEGETSEEEKCLPSIYNLQTYNSNKVCLISTRSPQDVGVLVWSYEGLISALLAIN